MIMYTAITYIIILIFIVLSAILSRILFIIAQNGHTTTRSRKTPAKTMIVLGSGGHTTEILRIVRHLDFNCYSPRIYIHARNDNLSGKKVKNVELNQIDYKVIYISRSREVRQSYFTSIWTTFSAFLNSLPIVWTENPDLILCNGPGTCVPICIIAFLFNVFFISTLKIIFVESFCRVKTLSLSGKILYYIADCFIVQWPYLSKPFYNRTIYVWLNVYRKCVKFISFWDLLSRKNAWQSSLDYRVNFMGMFTEGIKGKCFGGD